MPDKYFEKARSICPARSEDFIPTIAQALREAAIEALEEAAKQAGDAWNSLDERGSFHAHAQGIRNMLRNTAAALRDEKGRKENGKNH